MMLSPQEQQQAQHAIEVLNWIAARQLIAFHERPPIPAIDPALRNCTPWEGVILDVFITAMYFARRRPELAEVLTRILERGFSTLPGNTAAPESYEIQSLLVVDALERIMQDDT